MKNDMVHRGALAALMAAGLALGGAAVSACEPGFQVEEDASLQGVAEHFYQGESLWSAVKNPPAPKRQRGVQDYGGAEILFNIPCPDAVEVRTRTPDADLNYVPRLGEVVSARRLDLPRASTVRPVAQRQKPLALVSPAQVTLPVFDGDVPGSRLKNGPVVADAVAGIAPVTAVLDAVPAARLVEEGPKRVDGVALPVVQAVLRKPEFSVDLTVPPLDALAPTPVAETRAPLQLAVQDDDEPATLVPRPLPPAVAALAGAPELAEEDAAPVVESDPPEAQAAEVIEESTQADAEILAEESEIAEALARADEALEAAEDLISQQVQTRTAEEASLTTEPIRIMTGDDFRPFNDRNLVNGGLITEVVSSALVAASDDTSQVEVVWVDGWAGRIDETLRAGRADIAFPVPRPDCESETGEGLCKDYLFSDPLFEYFVQLFVDKGKSVSFERDADLIGRRLCRPEGWPTHMLDAGGRNWLADDKVALRQPALVSDCFFMLIAGEVDGVVLNRFTARETILAMGLDERIEAVAEQPIAISGLHAVVRKDNPQAEALLRQVNDGLAALRADGQFGEIVARHLQNIWDRL